MLQNTVQNLENDLRNAKTREKELQQQLEQMESMNPGDQFVYSDMIGMPQNQMMQEEGKEPEDAGKNICGTFGHKAKEYEPYGCACLMCNKTTDGEDGHALLRRPCGCIVGTSIVGDLQLLYSVRLSKCSKSIAQCN